MSRRERTCCSLWLCCGESELSFAVEYDRSMLSNQSWPDRSIMIKRRRLNVQARLPSASHPIPLGSDQRVSGGVKAPCALCGTDRRLRLSHIVPRWMCAPLKAQGSVIGRYGSLGVKTVEQDGTKHYLLCEDCEECFSRSERYLRTLILGESAEQSALGIRRDADHFHGVDSSHIHCFMMSVLFRAHLASAPPYHTVKVEPQLLSLITDCLRSGVFTSLNLKTAAIEFHSGPSGIDPQGMIQTQWLPDSGLFALTAAGWQLISMLCDHGGAAIAMKFPLEMFLETANPWTVLTADITEHRTISPWLYDDPLPEL